MKQKISLATLFSYIFLFLFYLSNLTQAQIAVGQWRDHLPYSDGRKVAIAGNKVYCATSAGLFFYDKDDNSLHKLSKINGLSDIGVSTINYDNQNNILIIGYSNGNIDMIKNNEIINISDIYRKQMIGRKTINDVLFIDNAAYLSCAFGIVVLNTDKVEISDTYFIGEDGAKVDIFELAANESYFYAATEKGIYYALRDEQNLVDYNNWTHDKTLTNPDAKYSTITYFNGSIYTNLRNEAQFRADTIFVFDGNSWNYFEHDYPGCRALETSEEKLVISSIYQITSFDKQGNLVNHVYSYPDFPVDGVRGSHALYDENQTLWIADKRAGLVKATDNWNSVSIHPNGPSSQFVNRIAIEDNHLWVAPGGTYSREGFFSFVDGTWTNFNEKNYSELTDLLEFRDIVPDPQNPNHAFAASWGFGVVEVNNGEIIEIYNETNSTLEQVEGFSKAYMLCGAVTMDNDQNLWVTNSGVLNPLSVKTASGEWHNFSHNDIGSLIGISTPIRDLFFTSDDKLWVILEYGNGILVFDANNTFTNHNDDQLKKFNVRDKDGTLITNEIYAIAEDQDGVIWLGTNKGIVVYYNPDDVFENNGDFYARQILIPEEDNDTTYQYLLASESVKSIAIDGGNRKWFGTEKAGVFLMSPDGTERIEMFNEDNSPLFSNNVGSIAINHETGEVFFGTDKGLISYKAGATKGDTHFTDVFVYPNPVRPGFEGKITITGLVSHVNVKITDIAGHLVFETTALGGQAIWDGKNFDGNKVQSGVYLVFCTNDDGTKTLITKLLFMN